MHQGTISNQIATGFEKVYPVANFKSNMSENWLHCSKAYTQDKKNRGKIAYEEFL